MSYMIRAWDDEIYGYVSRITAKHFELSDSTYALRWKTREDAKQTIVFLKSTGVDLKFRVHKAGDK